MKKNKRHLDSIIINALVIGFLLLCSLAFIPPSCFRKVITLKTYKDYYSHQRPAYAIDQFIDTTLNEFVVKNDLASSEEYISKLLLHHNESIKREVFWELIQYGTHNETNLNYLLQKFPNDEKWGIARLHEILSEYGCEAFINRILQYNSELRDIGDRQKSIEKSIKWIISDDRIQQNSACMFLRRKKLENHEKDLLLKALKEQDTQTTSSLTILNLLDEATVIKPGYNRFDPWDIPKTHWPKFDQNN